MTQLDELLGAASNLAKRGFAVVPIPARGYRNATGKGPVVSGWQHRRLALGEVQRVLKSYGTNAAGIGVVTGGLSNGLVVLDFDGDGWQAAFEHVLQAWPQLRNTPSVKTGSGRRHIWLRCPDLPEEFTRQEFYIGAGKVELRGNRCQVLVPPSLHPGGGRYEWLISLDDAPLAEVSFSALHNWLRQQSNRRSYTTKEARADDTGDEPPVRLGPEELALWLGKKAVDTADGNVKPTAECSSIDRSRTLFAIGLALARAGATAKTIAEALAQRDVALGYAKYTERRNGREEYERIAAKVLNPNREGESGAGPEENPHENTAAPEPERIYRHYMHLCNLLAGRFRWCPEWRTWLKWNGKIWERVPTEVVTTEATEVLKEFYTKQLQHSNDPQKWARRLYDIYSTKHVFDAVDLLRGHQLFITRASEFDADPYLLNTPGGVLDLRTLEIKEHDPGLLCTRITRGSPTTKTAEGTRWQRFLLEIFENDTKTVEYIQKSCGAALLGYNREQVLYVLYGTGANGKSVFVNSIVYALGDYAGNIPRDALLVHGQAQDARRVAYASLVGVRFGVLDELEDRTRLSSTALKDLTSNNPQAARGLYENYKQIRLGLTPFVATNAKPEITDHSLGTWRRLRLIPFTVTIPPEKRDHELEAKLRAEADAIMAWLVQGLRKYWTQGITEPPTVAAATEEYRAEEDVLLEWLNERTEAHPRAVTPTRKLFEDYCAWAQENDIAESERLTEKAFGRQLTAHGFPQNQARIGGKKTKVRRGIRLRTTPPHEVEPNGTILHEFQKTPVEPTPREGVFQSTHQMVPNGSTVEACACGGERTATTADGPFEVLGGVEPNGTISHEFQKTPAGSIPREGVFESTHQMVPNGSAPQTCACDRPEVEPFGTILHEFQKTPAEPIPRGGVFQNTHQMVPNGSTTKTCSCGRPLPPGRDRCDQCTHVEFQKRLEQDLVVVRKEYTCPECGRVVSDGGFLCDECERARAPGVVT